MEVSRMYGRIKGFLGKVSVLILLAPGAVHAKEEYVIGREEHPWVGSGTLENFDTSSEPGWIRVIKLDPAENLALDLWERGGDIDIPVWGPTIQAPREEKERLVDGDPTTAYIGRPRYSFGAWYQVPITLDLGMPFPVNRIRLISREEFRTHIIKEYKLLVWDGNPEHGFRLLRQDLENLSPVIDLDIPLQPIRSIRLRAGPLMSTWEVAEFEVYGEGYVPLPATYVSEVIDFGKPVVLGKIMWKGWREEGARVEIQTKTGDDDTPLVYWRKTGVGEEQVWWSEKGKPLTKEDYENLEIKAKGRITEDTEHWSFWSAPYNFDEGLGEGVPIASPSPRRYLQIRVRVIPTNYAGAGLDYIAFEFSPSVPAYEVCAEIYPTDVSPLRPTKFIYALRPRMTSENVGFNSLEVLTPMRADTVRSVRIDGRKVDFEVERYDDRFVVHFPKVTRDQTLVEVEFDCLVLKYFRFEGRIFDNELDELPQLVTSGDVIDRLPDDDISVRVSLEEPIVTPVAISPNPFTPDGDGVNDVTEVAYNLLRLEGCPVSLEIYHPSGSLVREVYKGREGSGRYTKEWDGRDDAGRLVPPGVYIYKLSVQADQEKVVRSGTVTVIY